MSSDNNAYYGMLASDAIEKSIDNDAIVCEQWLVHHGFVQKPNFGNRKWVNDEFSFTKDVAFKIALENGTVTLNGYHAWCCSACCKRDDMMCVSAGFIKVNFQLLEYDDTTPLTPNEMHLPEHLRNTRIRALQNSIANYLMDYVESGNNCEETLHKYCSNVIQYLDNQVEIIKSHNAKWWRQSWL